MNVSDKVDTMAPVFHPLADAGMGGQKDGRPMSRAERPMKGEKTESGRGASRPLHLVDCIQNPFAVFYSYEIACRRIRLKAFLSSDRAVLARYGSIFLRCFRSSSARYVCGFSV